MANLPIGRLRNITPAVWEPIYSLGAYSGQSTSRTLEGPHSCSLGAYSLGAMFNDLDWEPIKHAAGIGRPRRWEQQFSSNWLQTLGNLTH